MRQCLPDDAFKSAAFTSQSSFVYSGWNPDGYKLESIADAASLSAHRRHRDPPGIQGVRRSDGSHGSRDPLAGHLCNEQNLMRPMRKQWQYELAVQTWVSRTGINVESMILE